MTMHFSSVSVFVRVCKMAICFNTFRPHDSFCFRHVLSQSVSIEKNSFVSFDKNLCHLTYHLEWFTFIPLTIFQLVCTTFC